MYQFSRELFSAKIPIAIKWNSEYTLKMGDNAPESGITVWFDGKKDIGNGRQPTVGTAGGKLSAGEGLKRD